jgi:hypothetical protein
MVYILSTAENSEKPKLYFFFVTMQETCGDWRASSRQPGTKYPRVFFGSKKQASADAGLLRSDIRRLIR